MLLCTLALLPLVGAPDAAAPVHPPAAALVEDEKATEWADQPGKKALTKTIGKLRKAASDEMLRQGREEVLAFGPGAAPGLLAALGKEKNEDAADRFREALDSITTQAHTRLLAAEFDAKRTPTQLYAMRRAAELGDPGLREDVEARWSELQEMKADPKRKKKVTEELELHVAVLTLSTGSPASLAACLAVAGDKAYSAGSRRSTPRLPTRARPAGGGRPARRGAVEPERAARAPRRAPPAHLGRARGPRRYRRARRPGEQRQDRGHQRPAPHRRRRGADRRLSPRGDRGGGQVEEAHRRPTWDPHDS